MLPVAGLIAALAQVHATLATIRLTPTPTPTPRSAEVVVQP